MAHQTKHIDDETFPTYKVDWYIIVGLITMCLSYVACISMRAGNGTSSSHFIKQSISPQLDLTCRYINYMQISPSSTLACIMPPTPKYLFLEQLLLMQHFLYHFFAKLSLRIPPHLWNHLRPMFEICMQNMLAKLPKSCLSWQKFACLGPEDKLKFWMLPETQQWLTEITFNKSMEIQYYRSWVQFPEVAGWSHNVMFWTIILLI